jgi:hypothetical protein
LVQSTPVCLLPTADQPVAMGIRKRLKSRVKGAVQSIRALGAVVQEEANHPGRPQPHMAARSPVWGGESGASEPAAMEEETSSSVAPEAPGEDDSGEEVPWFLKYEDNEGWDDPNPGQSDPS